MIFYSGSLYGSQRRGRKKLQCLSGRSVWRIKHVLPIAVLHLQNCVHTQADICYKHQSRFPLYILILRFLKILLHLPLFLQVLWRGLGWEDKRASQILEAISFSPTIVMLFLFSNNNLTLVIPDQWVQAQSTALCCGSIPCCPE